MTEDELDWPPPESRFVDEAVALERIRDLTTTARTTWLVLIGFLAFIGLTLLSVRDVDFFSVAATTDLPIVNIAIPTTTFFWTAALLAAVLHCYFHVFLLKLWDALAEAPARIDDLKLGDRIFPWLVNDWALRRRMDPDRPVTERPLDWLADAVTFLLIWLATPIVLAGFWWRSMPAHDARVSLAIAAALWISLFASMRGWRRARGRLAQQGLIAKPRQHRTLGHWFGVARRGVVTGVLWLLMLAGVPLLAFATIAGAGGHHLAPIVENTLTANWPDDWGAIPLASANLIDAEIAIEPDNWHDRETARRRFHLQWCTDNGLSAQACESPLSDVAAWAQRRWCLQNGIADSDCTERFATLDEIFEAEWATERREYISNIRGREMRGRDLRHADASGAFFAGVDLRKARLEGVNLRMARLEEANLTLAEMDGANLTLAWLEGANLGSAGLEGASLREARLEGANLRRARLERADLTRASLEGANLASAGLQGANLTHAGLEGANLASAGLESAHLWGARLSRANLSEARLEGANLGSAGLERAQLWRARLQGVNLWRARLQGAILWKARLEGANLTKARLEGAYLVEARLQGANLGMARLERANLRAARLQGAYLGGAQLTKAHLSGARLNMADLSGAVLDQATLVSVEWAGATIGPSPAHSANFTGGQNLTQSQLDLVIGDENTILPRDAESGKPLHVWSCWEAEAAARFIAIWVQRSRQTAEDYWQNQIERGWICGPDNPRRPVGTPAEDVTDDSR